MSSKGAGFRVDPDALSRAADQLHAHADEVEGHGRTLAAKTGGRVGHGPIGQVAEDLVKRGIRGVSEGVSKAVADFHRGTAKGLKAAATRTTEADARAARSFKDLERSGSHDVPRPTGAPTRTLPGPATVKEPATGRVGYGDTELSRAVQDERLKDANRGSNYASARLDDGSIIRGKSSTGVHAEEDLIAQAKASDRKIRDLYSEREPCDFKCQVLTKDMNVTYTWKWNDVDNASTKALRAASNADIKVAVTQLFMGTK
jgi:hypothetical protein